MNFGESTIYLIFVEINPLEMKKAPKDEKSRTMGFDLKIGRSGFGLTSGHLTRTQFFQYTSFIYYRNFKI